MYLERGVGLFLGEFGGVGGWGAKGRGVGEEL